MSATIPGPIPGPVPMPMGMSTPELGSIPGFELDHTHGPEPSHGPQPASSYSIHAEVHKRNNRDLTEQGRELGKYVRDLYNAGGKLFDKEMFRETEEAVAVVPRPAVIQIRSMNGQYRHKYVPKEGFDAKFHKMGDFSVDNWRLSASFTIAQSLFYQADEKNLDYDDEDESRPWTVKPALDDEDRILGTRAFTLARSGERFLNTPMDVLRATWEESRYNWERSRTCIELLRVLPTIQCPANATKMICFGLGSLDGSENWETLDDRCDADGLPLRAAMTQHCAALTMAAAFGAQIGKPPLKVLAQDPAYSPGQTALLAEKGIEVIPGIGALGFTYVDEDTIVFSCHPDVPVKQIIADLAKPAGMIWDAVKPAERERSGWEVREAFGTEVICSPWVTDEDSVRTRELITGYNKINFPYERERFGRLEIYMRKPE